MSLKLKEIPDFPQYVVAEDGTIFMNDYGRLKKRRSSSTQDGQVKITLYKHGVAYTRSLALIVARAWVYNDFDPNIFDTPIHLDNDLRNNHAHNLAWRPRWFSLKYQRQYWNEEYRYATTSVRDTKTGEVYHSLMDVCQKHGLLYVDVLNSCTRGEVVFPTWRTFVFNN